MAATYPLSGNYPPRRAFWAAVAFLAAFLAAFLTEQAQAAGPDISSLSLPPGFKIEVVSDDVPNARQMALSDTGVLYVGSRRAGNLYAVTGAFSTDTSEVKVQTIASDLVMPSGLVWHKGSLYVGALNRVLRYDDIDNKLASPPEPVVIANNLPDKKHHGWKYLNMGPDDALYVPVGAPCNICKSKDPRFASILRMDPATGETSIYAEGIRNTVGMAWHPERGELYFTDNGRDMLGDDVPQEEVNRVTSPGRHYGYPYIHAGTISDPEFGKDHKPSEFEPPLLKIQAHSAALGIDFYTGKSFPQRYQNALFIAEHGSWNRTKKVGYRVSVMFETDEGPQYAPFITGWLDGQASWGRPNDVLATPDGNLLISDDQTGTIYRVSYSSPIAANSHN